MAIFKAYSKYYDLFYRDKNYSAEANYIDSLIRRYTDDSKVTTLLDVGCGTGTHAHFLARKGYRITGIDIAPEMVALAKRKKIANAKFCVGDATRFDLRKRFDTVLSLFHVMDYHLTDRILKSAISSAVKHIEPGGLFIFDVWYGPCVIADPPNLRVKEIEDNEAQIVRLSVPDFYPQKNRVNVNFRITVLNKKTYRHVTIEETHKVRYLFDGEIRALLADAGIDVLTSEEWLTGRKPSKNTFSVCYVGRLKK